MDFLPAFKICGSGLAAQKAKMDVIISNLANINTTRTPEGGPYKKRSVVFSSEPLKENFNDILQMVKVEEIVQDKGSVKKVFDPGHPDADAEGNVAMPDINTIAEMADMITANRAYEACVTAFDATKNMALKALELGK
ncbi:MAG: flagellar basal body rod protein FlgC [Deltaproteobacteria bacterium]|nr:MAG: flagellar basal body rod protein FlgC [Deltaproteobacteria bacterium]